MVEGLTSAAIAITTYATVATAAPAVLAVTALFAAVALGDRLKKKSAQLEEESYHVLITLNEIGPVTPVRLVEALNGIPIYGLDMWNETRTVDALRALQAVRLGDGSVDALVNQAAEPLEYQWDLNQRQKNKNGPGERGLAGILVFSSEARLNSAGVNVSLPMRRIRSLPAAPPCSIWT